MSRRRRNLLPPLTLLASLLAALGCNAPAPRTEATPSPSLSPAPLPTPGSRTEAPSPTQETGPSPFPTPPGSSEAIAIVGDPGFVEQTQGALRLLEAQAPEAYDKVLTYVGVIEQSERSGMWAYEVPPRYAVSDVTAFYSLTWYASTIAHDATHSELYHEYQAAHPGEPVPSDVWTGFEVERFCNAYQLDVLTRIGGPAHEVDYLAGLSGTHCDIDGDLDCDWDDFEGRDW